MKLGKRVKDKITGFEGILVARAEYITGCDQYLLQPDCKPETFIEGRWIDEGRLEIIGDGVKIKNVLAEKDGADISAPIK